MCVPGLGARKHKHSCFPALPHQLPLHRAPHSPSPAASAPRTSPSHPQVEVPGVENINLSRLVASHRDYLAVMDDVLEVINMHDA